VLGLDWQRTFSSTRRRPNEKAVWRRKLAAGRVAQGIAGDGGTRLEIAWRRRWRPLLGTSAAGAWIQGRLIGPQFVKPYVKRNKNDANDAEAICEA